MSLKKIKTPVAILGFGVEGRAAYEFLKSQGIEDVTICDENPDLLLPAAAKKQIGKHAFENLSEFKTLIRSPGFPYEQAEVQRVKRMGTLVTSLTKLTLQLAAQRLTALTGSNGKTTTVSLIAHILHAHYGEDLIVGGNDRTPVLKQALTHSGDPILMELSSFQLMDCGQSPHIAAVLNITPNHLDWHATTDEYANAKANILAHQHAEDWVLLNANDPGSASLADSATGQVFWVGKQKGKNWAVWKEGKLIVHHNRQDFEICKHRELKCKTHPDNFLFAAAIAILHGVSKALIKKAMKSFTGVPHRLEHVRSLNEVEFYNDSSCTTPTSTLVAIDQFPAEKLILMLGGSSKNADFTQLAYAITQKQIRVYLYGQEATRLSKALEEAGGQSLILKHDTSTDFRQIVHNVYNSAQPGDVIVLSPACASFDMFKNAKARGEQFKSAVMGL